MKILLDTNVTLRNLVSVTPQHGLVQQALVQLTAGGHELCIASQSLFEFWVVATRPLAVNGFGLAPATVRPMISDLLTGFQFLPDPVDLVTRWADLCERHQVAGKQAHDTRLVALMVAHGITHLLTLNPRDFARFSEITVLEPKDV